MSEQYGGPPGPDWSNRPGPYQPPGGHGFGHTAPAPTRRPVQVTAASWISIFLGAVTALLGLLLLTPTGPEVMRLLTGSADNQAAASAMVFVCAAAYVVPAIYLRQRRSWARIAVIVIAALGVAGGLLSLPGSIIGLGLHVALIVMMLQQPTKEWFAG